ncbi:MAG: methyltransferase domain-containing protein [Erysipelotrichaceae bacterium]|nr:methyltransferase domain-containing protein [Erysipelotrichaceae bacterium]MBO4538583.1 methyltransferase domain-containing protein [Erysipelotrichaceae bacterium]
MLRCPNCGSELVRAEKCYRCAQGHSFDIASQGYVNLLIRHSANPGDDGISIASREAFLTKGYYQLLAEAIRETVSSSFQAGESFLDAGCGTGYYLQFLQDLPLRFYATDIAKKAVARCARSNPEAVCFVGNVFHLPFDDGALDGLMSVFTPYSAEEFARIVRPGGHLIAVTPGREHLYQLKQIAYEQPYYNQEEGYQLPDFHLAGQRNVRYPIHLETSQDIANLWRMMPYYHTTSRQGNERLLALSQADTTVDFLVQLFERKSGNE